MTDEKKGEKTEPWVPVEKIIAKTLPTDRPYTDAEAIISLELDRNSGRQVTAQGYIYLWRWGKKRFYRFMDEHGFKIAYDPKLRGKKARGKVMKRTGDSKGTERGPHKPKDSQRLRESRDRKGTARGHNYKELKNKETDTNVSVKESKDSYVVFSQSENLLQFWNQLPRPSVQGRKRPIHLPPKEGKEETDVRRRSRRAIEDLLNGTFWKNRVLVTDWADQNNIPKQYRGTRRWSVRKIKRGLELMSRLYVEGYWPPNKKKLPKDLPTLFYNPDRNTSFFFQCYFTATSKPNSDKLDPRFEEYAKEMPERFSAHIKKLAPSIKAIETWCKDQFKQGNKFDWKWEKNPEFFVLAFFDWVAKEKDWLDGPPHPKAVRPGGQFFEEYLDFLEEENNVKFIRDA